VIHRKLANPGGGRFLQEKRELVRTPPRREKNPEILRLFRGHPHAQTEHVHRRERRQFPRELQHHVPAGDQRHRAGRRLPQHAPVFRKLEIEQGLIETLAERPAQRRHRHQRLPHRGIRRQPAAFAPAMNDELARPVQPGAERHAATRLAPGRGEQVGRAAAGTQFAVGRIAGGKPVRARTPFQFRELSGHERRQGNEVLKGKLGRAHGGGQHGAIEYRCPAEPRNGSRSVQPLAGRNAQHARLTRATF
jgi:hypothetical protein